jgi:hypothetical protein
MNHIGFRSWRRGKGFTQQQAATYLHRSIATIRAWEADPKRNQKHRNIPDYLTSHLKALEWRDQHAGYVGAVKDRLLDMLTRPDLTTAEAWQAAVSAWHAELDPQAHPPPTTHRKRGRPRKLAS